MKNGYPKTMVRTVFYTSTTVGGWVCVSHRLPNSLSSSVRTYPVLRIYFPSISGPSFNGRRQINGTFCVKIGIFAFITQKSLNLICGRYLLTTFVKPFFFMCLFFVTWTECTCSVVEWRYCPLVTIVGWRYLQVQISFACVYYFLI